MLLFSSGSHKQTWRDDALVKDHRTIYTYETILFWLVLPQSQIVEFIFPPSLCNLASSIFFFNCNRQSVFFSYQPVLFDIVQLLQSRGNLAKELSYCSSWRFFFSFSRLEMF